MYFILKKRWFSSCFCRVFKSSKNTFRFYRYPVLQTVFSKNHRSSQRAGEESLRSTVHVESTGSTQYLFLEVLDHLRLTNGTMLEQMLENVNLKSRIDGWSSHALILKLVVAINTVLWLAIQRLRTASRMRFLALGAHKSISGTSRSSSLHIIIAIILALLWIRYLRERLVKSVCLTILSWERPLSSRGSYCEISRCFEVRRSHLAPVDS